MFLALFGAREAPKLFDEVERTETRAKNQREPTFSYLNSSARPIVAAARTVLELLRVNWGA